MKILYFGLSKNIRGVAEALQGESGYLYFVKPGDVVSRKLVARQILAANSIGVIVVAETLGDNIPQTKTIIRNLREQNVRQPIVGLTNHFSERILSEFLDAGGDVLLPMRSRNGYFTINGNLLMSQINRLIILKYPPKLISPPPPHSSPSSIPMQDRMYFNGFALTANGDFSLFGINLSLPPRDRKLLEVFIKAGSNTVSIEDIRQSVYGGNTSISQGTMRGAVSALQKNIKANLDNVGCSFNFPLVEAVIEEGWRLNISNLKKLNGILNFDPPPTEEDDLPKDPRLQKYRSNHEMLGCNDFTFEPTKRKIYFRSNPLELSPTYIKILTTLFRAEGAVVSRHQLYHECYPPASGVSDKTIAPFVNRAAKKLLTELERLGMEITFPLVETIGKSGWALKQETLKHLETIKPAISDLERSAQLVNLEFS